MRQHLDITDVEAQTKIRAKYLRALENEDFGMLPGPTFVKSFLRTYAEFLGLDPHLLVEEYRVRYDPRDESELTPFARPTRGRERRRPPRRAARPAGPRTRGGVRSRRRVRRRRRRRQRPRSAWRSGGLRASAPASGRRRDGR